MAKADLTLVTVNPTYKAEELAYVIEDSAAEVLFFVPRIRHLELIDHLRTIRGQLSSLRHAYLLSGAEDDFDDLTTLLELGRGVSDREAEERAARTMNKERREAGETKEQKRSS